VALALVCPFCGELFLNPTQRTCPECGVVLRRADQPATALRDQEDEAVAPEDRPLAWHSLAHGRGLVLAVAVLGIAMFFSPWLIVRTPAEYRFSGFDLTTTRAFWFGGGVASWFVVVPLLLTRRTENQLRGVRGISSLLASVTLWQVILMFAQAPPSNSAVHYEFAYGAVASAVLSGLGSVLSLRLGLPQQLALRRRPAKESEQSGLH
jgi:hypothetical protein